MNPWNETVTIRCASTWDHLVDEFINAASEAWNFNKNDAIIDKGYVSTEIKIKFDFDILKNYLGYEILYRPGTKLGVS